MEVLLPRVVALTPWSRGVRLSVSRVAPWETSPCMAASAPGPMTTPPGSPPMLEIAAPAPEAVGSVDFDGDGPGVESPEPELELRLSERLELVSRGRGSRRSQVREPPEEVPERLSG